MTIYIDFSNKICFILSPKCGTQSVCKYLKINLDTHYSDDEIVNCLTDYNFKKIIVVRNIIDRFFSGFYEDLCNNDCYYNLNISFYNYIKFLCYCYDNKIKNVNKLNIYYEKDYSLIYWGQCSNMHLPITDCSGNISGHITHQKKYIEPYINIINKTENVEVIDINELSKFINLHENAKNINNNTNNNEYDFNTLLSEIKKKHIFPSKEKILNDEIKQIIKHIYSSDEEYIEIIKLKFNNKTKK